jgi:hypothetical protein
MIEIAGGCTIILCVWDDRGDKNASRNYRCCSFGVDPCDAS